MEPMEVRRDGYVISTDKGKLDLGAIHGFLSRQSYWAQGRTLEVVRTTIENSLCFGLYDSSGAQVGFGRVVTDGAIYAILCDMFVNETQRGKGLSKWLLECILTHPRLRTVSRFLLGTRDAHELYRKYGGFTELRLPHLWMERTIARAE